MSCSVTATPARVQRSDQSFLPSLTPLRGVAALWVVLFHYETQVFPNFHSERYSHLIHAGYLAVDLFFLLSGFVLTHVYQETFSRRVCGENYGRFLTARIARLYPAHIAVLLLFVATSLGLQAMSAAHAGAPSMPLEGPRSLLALLANLAMVQGLHASVLSWNYPEWSISLEFVAYLGFPFLLPRILRAGAAGKLAIALLLFAALGVFARLGPDFNRWDGLQALLRCLPEFLLGSLLYTVYRGGAAAAWANDGTLVAIALATALMLHLDAPDILVICCFAALVLAAVANDGRGRLVLNSTGLVWLGDVSYSIYLLHGLVQFLVTKTLALGFGIGDPEFMSMPWSLTIFAMMLAMTLALSALSYRYVELSGRRYLRAALSPRERRSRLQAVTAEPHAS